MKFISQIIIKNLVFFRELDLIETKYFSELVIIPWSNIFISNQEMI